LSLMVFNCSYEYSNIIKEEERSYYSMNVS
jgi:hypothetical protein